MLVEGESGGSFWGTFHKEAAKRVAVANHLCVFVSTTVSGGEGGGSTTMNGWLDKQQRNKPSLLKIVKAVEALFSYL
jgi:hypothetical protein